MKNLIVICFFLFLPILIFSQCSPSGYIPQHDNFFGIYTATLEGKEMKILINSSWQEMSHPRVSPDGEWVTFTRYNMKDSDGIAQEANGYLLTEIMIMKSDGTDVKTLVPKMNDTMNANSSWTPDGNHLLYVTTDTPNGTPAIAKIHIYSKERTFIKTPKDAIVSDPNQCGEWICFPLREANHSQQNIWVMKEDGSEVYQLTKETIIQRHENMEFLLGDYDPHFSPDAQEIAFMRYYGGTEWHLVVIDLETGQDKDLTENRISNLPLCADTTATWSPDGKTILFRHIELPSIEKIGLYTSSPDGTNRVQLPLPDGYFFGTISSFYPSTSSSNQDKIIFHARKDDRF
jgi:Tol biopolymer transport system component